MHDHAICEAAPSHEPEHAVAGLPAEHLRAARLHGARDLEPGDVAGAPGRRGIGALALREVGRVEARVRDAHEQFLAARHGVGQLVETDDLVAAGSGEYDCAHVCSLAWTLGGSLVGLRGLAAGTVATGRPAAEVASRS